MTVIEHKLLRREGTHTVPKQAIRLTWMFLLCRDSKRNHVFDKLIKAGRTEIAKAIGGFCREAVSAMIVPVNDKLCLH